MPNDVYSTEEKVYFVKEFFRGTSLRRISSKFIEKNSNRPKPSPATIMNAVKRFNATGNVNREGTYKQPRKALSDDIKASICQKRICDNNLSISAIAKIFDISTTSVRSILRENGLYKKSYKPSAKSSNKTVTGSRNEKSKRTDTKMTNKSHGTAIVDNLQSCSIQYTQENL